MFVPSLWWLVPWFSGRLLVSVFGSPLLFILCVRFFRLCLSGLFVGILWSLCLFGVGRCLWLVLGVLGVSRLGAVRLVRLGVLSLLYLDLCCYG